jgi:hypothetical protein
MLSRVGIVFIVQIRAIEQSSAFFFNVSPFQIEQEIFPSSFYQNFDDICC